MKAISIQQPWAWAIIHAGKDIENRTWTTAHRGEIAIHATRLQEKWTLPPGVAAPAPQDLTLGAVIGVIEIVEVVRKSSSPWFLGPLGFVLRNPRPLAKPVRCKGNQLVWKLPSWVENAIRAQLAAEQPTTAPRSRKASQRPSAAPATRILKVTPGNLKNNHLYLRDAMDLFPADALGGRTRAQCGRCVRVHWGDESVETDIVGARGIFRSRGWLRRFFAATGIKAGDQVKVERLETYVFRISKVEG